MDSQPHSTLFQSSCTHRTDGSGAVITGCVCETGGEMLLVCVLWLQCEEDVRSVWGSQSGAAGHRPKHREAVQCDPPEDSEGGATACSSILWPPPTRDCCHFRFLFFPLACEPGSSACVDVPSLSELSCCTRLCTFGHECRVTVSQATILNASTQHRSPQGDCSMKVQGNEQTQRELQLKYSCTSLQLKY